uniref:Uncharacterized protein n=1 Tax=Rhizophora mucronata TaxID=61149 RepID=A0A2P2PAI2_RHIMU
MAIIMQLFWEFLIIACRHIGACMFYSMANCAFQLKFVSSF